MGKKKIEVSVCMGSSCYPRGNRNTLEALKKYIAKNHLEKVIELKGNLCQGQCKQGPNIRINGTLYHNINEVSVIEIINHLLENE